MKTLKIYPAIFLFFSLTFLIYFPAIEGDFIWDDDVYVSENKQLISEEGLQNIWFKPGATVQYYPLVFTSFWVEYRLWGEDTSGYHIVNLLLHASSALLLWRLLVLLSVPGAGLAALIFLMHPVNVESVAWITERKNMLSGFFYLASLNFYLSFLQIEAPSSKNKVPKKNIRLFYILSIICFLLAMFSKTVTCTLPAVILLIIWWKKDSIKFKDILRVTPFLMLVLILIPITLATEKLAGTQGADWDFSFAERFIIAGKALWFYLYKLVLPLNLTFSYPKWSVDSAVISHYLPSLGFLALIAGLGFSRDKLGKTPLVAILFFAGTLFPALGFFSVYPMRYSFAADHFQYLACIGPIALFSSFLTTLPSLATSGMLGRIKPYFLPAFSTSILLVLGILTWKQTHIYKNVEVLWRDTLSKNPSSWIAHNNFGVELLKQGKLEESFEHYRKAAALNPSFPETHYNLGLVYDKKGEIDLAVSHYKTAVKLRPSNEGAHNNLAYALSTKGKHKEAISHYKMAIKIKPDFAETHYNLANNLSKIGKLDEAISHYKTAIKIKPDYPKAHYNLGNALFDEQKLEEAIAHFKIAIKIKPDYLRAYINLGNALFDEQKLEEAIAHYKMAIKIKPDFAEAHYNLANTLLKIGKRDEAISHFKIAIEVNPDFSEARHGLEKALLRSNKAPMKFNGLNENHLSKKQIIKQIK